MEETAITINKRIGEKVQYWPDSRKKETCLRIMEHAKTVKMPVAVSMEGISQATYYHWMRKFRLGANQFFEEVSKPEVRTVDGIPPYEAPMKVELPVEELVKMLASKCESLVLIADTGSALYTKVKGTPKEYDTLQAILGLRALGQFKELSTNERLIRGEVAGGNTARPAGVPSAPSGHNATPIT